MSQIKYSVLIPTRNGMPYLEYAARSVLDSNRKDFELIVSINKSSDNSTEKLQSINDSRMRVIHTDVDLSMSEHYDFIIRQARGEWIQIIGDDDAIFPWYFESLDKITSQHQDIKVITWERAYFNWNESSSTNSGFSFHILARKFERKLNIQKNLFKVLLKTRSIFQMPQTYTGSAISRSVIEDLVREFPNGIYLSIIPDVYSSVILANFRYPTIYTGVPLTIVGTSKKTMSQGNRIYEEKSHNNKKDKLALKVPQELHVLGLPTLFIIEVLLNLPSEIDVLWRRALTKYLCYAGVKFDMRRINSLSHENKSKISAYLKSESTQYNLNFTVIQFISLFLELSSWVSKLSKKISNTVYRRILRKQQLIESPERIEITNILEFARNSPALTDKYYSS